MLDYETSGRGPEAQLVTNRLQRKESSMNQNRLYMLLGALIVAVIVMGIYIWREESKPEGIELRLDKNGVSVQEN